MLFSTRVINGCGFNESPTTAKTLIVLLIEKSISLQIKYPLTAAIVFVNLV